MRKILTLLFVLVALAGQAKEKTIVWEELAVGYSPNPQFMITKVEFSKACRSMLKLHCCGAMLLVGTMMLFLLEAVVMSMQRKVFQKLLSSLKKLLK